MPEKNVPQPLETVYNGRRFRSRLEARWSVFFHTLHIVHEYEPEGFDLGSLGWYLPDFWISSWDAYVEVKPDTPFDIEFGANRLARLAEMTGKHTFLIAGQPRPREHKVWLDGEGADGDSVPFTEFADCRRCDGLCLLLDGNGLTAEDCIQPLYPHALLPTCAADIGRHTCGDHDRYPLSALGSGANIKVAYDAASSERFE